MASADTRPSALGQDTHGRWDVDDPARQPLEKVREIRDDVEQRVRELVEERADEIRTDRSGHARRLAQLLPNLVAEFDGIRTPDEIRACADAILNKFDDAPVRSSCSHSPTVTRARASAPKAATR
jgi:hypothetical protein